MTQREMMRKLLMQHGHNERAVCAAYAQAERDGLVPHERNRSGYSPEGYARAVWRAGHRNSGGGPWILEFCRSHGIKTDDNDAPDDRFTWRDGDLKLIDPETGRARRIGDVPEKWRVYNDDKKADQASVDYTAKAKNPDDACIDCKFFLNPNACAKVKPPISPEGWCEKFEADVSWEDSQLTPNPASDAPRPPHSDALEDCHSPLGRLLGSEAERVEVLRCAEEHRAYWRPKKVRVLLLAESHVYTADSELCHQVDFSNFRGSEMVPRGFVRLVYCLGYGENKLLNQSIPKNFGTPQYWKIFYSCVNRVYTNDDFRPILRRTPFAERIQNKLALLHRLQETGVWLLDTSLAALYPKPNSRKLIAKCLQTSWDAYVGQVVRTAEPSFIICIGKGVHQYLGARLSNLGIPIEVLPQPNARLSSAKHLRVFQKYHDVIQQVNASRHSG